MTVLSVAPDLATAFDVPEAITRSFAFSREGNSRFWTLRIAHGLTDLCLEWAAGEPVAPTLCFGNTHRADATDREFVAVLLARAKDSTLRVLVGDDAPFVEQPELSVRELRDRSAHCMRMAYYDACLDYSRRGLANLSTDPDPGESSARDLARNALFSLLLLDRLDETVAFSEEIRRTSEDPALLSHAAYAMAIFYVRAYPPEKRDYALARTWVARTHEFAEQAPPSESRTVNLVFLQNTLALVEMRSARPDVALTLLSEGLDCLARDAPSKPEESVILLYNRARLHTMRGDFESALLDYRTVVEREPGNSGAHLDRGILLQRLERHEEALAAYDAAIEWSPPYDEPHFNRAQLLSALGRTEEALAAYSRVLVLEPLHVNALVNRAGLFLESGRVGEATVDVERALTLAPKNAKAWCLHGMLALTEERVDDALASLDRAVDCDDTEWTAYVNRATAWSRRGDLSRARRDLDRALGLHEDVTALENRALIADVEGRHEDAARDRARAAEMRER